VFKSAYAVIRPSLVGRTNTIPYAGDCDGPGRVTTLENIASRIPAAGK